MQMQKSRPLDSCICITLPCIVGKVKKQMGKHQFCQMHDTWKITSAFADVNLPRLMQMHESVMLCFWFANLCQGASVHVPSHPPSTLAYSDTPTPPAFYSQKLPSSRERPNARVRLCWLALVPLGPPKKQSTRQSFLSRTVIGISGDSHRSFFRQSSDSPLTSTL